MPLHVYAPFQSMLYVNPFIGINFKVVGKPSGTVESIDGSRFCQLFLFKSVSKADVLSFSIEIPLLNICSKELNILSNYILVVLKIFGCELISYLKNDRKMKK